MIRNIIPRMGLRRAFVQPTTTSIRYQSTGGYGDQGGDPISNNPQDQGPRPRIETEHPGPEPVAEGRGKGGVKGKPVPEETHGTAGANSGSMSNSQENPQPKINAQIKPGGEQSEDVKKHNEDLKNRNQNEVATDKERVGKGFWNRSGDETA